MTVTKLHYYLGEEAEYFHPCQTAFLQNLGTHDSLFLLLCILRKTNHKQPHVMVAQELHKLYDTVTHTAVLEALAEAYPGIVQFNPEFFGRPDFPDPLSPPRHYSV